MNRSILLLFFPIALFLFYGCSDDRAEIKDVIAEFGDGLTANDVVKVKDLMSEESDPALKNSNWNGLALAMYEATDNGNIDYGFASLTINLDGSDAETSCAVIRTYLGSPTPDRNCLIKFHYEDRFLLIFAGSWKIKEWWFDSVGDGVLRRQFIK